MRNCRQKRDRTFCPSFEQLEPRQMLSLSTPLINGSLSLEPLIIPGIEDQAIAEIGTQPDLRLPTHQPIAEEPSDAESQSSTEAQQQVESVQLGLAGDGFFIVEGDQGEFLFTRIGNFEVNEQNELVTEQGRRLLGFGANEDGELVRRLTPLIIPFDREATQATSTLHFSGNLRPQAAIGERTGTLTLANIFDKEGREIPLAFEFVRVHIDSATETAYDWVATRQSPDSANEIIGSGTLRFGSQGQAAGGQQTSLLIEGEFSTFSILLDFSSITSIVPITGQASIVETQQFDGFPPGPLEDFQISEKGRILGIYATDLVRTLGQVQLAIIANPHGLTKVGQNLYALSANSGQPQFGDPNTGLHAGLVQIPNSHYLRPDGAIVARDETGPRNENRSSLSTLNIRYPWLIRSVNLKLEGNEFFIVEGRNGKLRYTRDGRFHLNAQHQLVTRTGLRVLGLSLSDREAGTSRLSPLTVPLGSITTRATQNVVFQGNHNPEVEPAVTPGIIESLVLYESESSERVNESTKLIDVAVRQGDSYRSLFEPGELQLTGSRGSGQLPSRTLTITPETTVSDLLLFMQQALVIDTSDELPDDSAGVFLKEGRIRVVSNLGELNELRIGLSSIQLKAESQDIAESVPFFFSEAQEADGVGTAAEFIVFDSLGIEHRINISTYLESRDAESSTVRWIAITTGNSAAGIEAGVVGRGSITYSNAGEVILGGIGEITFESLAQEQQTVALNFEATTSLAEGDPSRDPKLLGPPTTWRRSISTFEILSQDGFGPGALERFSVSESGELIGSYTNGQHQALGQIQLAKFTRPFLLRPKGLGLFVASRKSGEAQIVTPNEPGVGAVSQQLSIRSRSDNGKADTTSPRRHFLTKRFWDQYGIEQQYRPFIDAWTSFRSSFNDF